MRVLNCDQFLVRIFLGESDKWHHIALARAILERLRKGGVAGATVVHGGDRLSRKIRRRADRQDDTRRPRGVAQPVEVDPEGTRK